MRVRSGFVWSLVLAGGLAPQAGLREPDAQGLSPNTTACGLLPLADLQSYYGAKPGPPRGMVSSALSTCTVAFGENVVKLQASPPGTAGLPTTIAMGLRFVKELFSTAKDPMVGDVQTKDFGNVGCATMKATMRLPGAAANRRPLYTTTCFVVSGGYLSLAVADEDPARVSFERIKQFTEKAAAKRRT